MQVDRRSRQRDSSDIRVLGNTTNRFTFRVCGYNCPAVKRIHALLVSCARIAALAILHWRGLLGVGAGLLAPQDVRWRPSVICTLAVPGVRAPVWVRLAWASLHLSRDGSVVFERPWISATLQSFWDFLGFRRGRLGAGGLVPLKHLLSGGPLRLPQGYDSLSRLVAQPRNAIPAVNAIPHDKADHPVSLAEFSHCSEQNNRVFILFGVRARVPYDL